MDTYFFRLSKNDKIYPAGSLDKTYSINRGDGFNYYLVILHYYLANKEHVIINIADLFYYRLLLFVVFIPFLLAYSLVRKIFSFRHKILNNNNYFKFS